MKKLEAVIEYYGVELLVHFEIDGHYIPANCDYPAEYPEMLIKKVFAGDVEITEILLDLQLDDLYELLNNQFEL